MKKITFFTFLFVASLGFSQEILIDGGFDSGVAAPNWTGNGAGANVVDDGSTTNFVNAALVGAAAEGWQTSLQQIVVLTQGQAYDLSFDAYVDAGTATMKAGLGQNGGDFSSAGTDATETITTTLTNFSYTFTPGYDTVTNAARVFFDMGGTANDGITINIDNVSLIEGVAVTPTCTDGIMNGDETGVDCGGPDCPACPVAAAPTSPAPTPPGRAASDVVNVYSAAYAGSKVLTPDTFGVVSNNSTAVVGTIMGDDYWGITYIGGDFMGFNLDAAADASAMTYFHMDYWVEGTPTGGVFNPKWSNHSAGHLTGETSAAIHTFAPGGNGQWNSLDIEITQFNVGEFNGGINPGTNRAVLSQLIMQASGAAGALFENIYLDNIYFHNNIVLGIEDFDRTTFRAFPNPTNGDWNISSSSVINRVAVYDILGKQVISLAPNSNEVVIDASSLNTGIYFAKIEGNNGSKTVKLIKE